jgi:hypothetical protein
MNMKPKRPRHVSRCIWRRLAIVVALSSTGCGRAQDTAASPPSTDGGATEAAKPCPLGVAGTRATIEDAPGGVTIALSAGPDHVDELRRRAHDAAMLRGAGAHEGEGHEGKHFGSQQHGLRLTSLPPASVTVEETPEGAKLHVTATVPSQVDGLREQARQSVERVMRVPCERH